MTDYRGIIRCKQKGIFSIMTSSRLTLCAKQTDFFLQNYFFNWKIIETRIVLTLNSSYFLTITEKDCNLQHSRQEFNNNVYSRYLWSEPEAKIVRSKYLVDIDRLRENSASSKISLIDKFSDQNIRVLEMPISSSSSSNDFKSSELEKKQVIIAHFPHCVSFS